MREELARLSAALGDRVSLLTDDEVSSLRESARRTVLSRLREQEVTVMADQNDGAVRAVQAADDLANELRDVRVEFASARKDIDGTSALVHQKTCVVLAASRKPIDERSYMAALNAVASAPSTGRGSDPDLERHLEAAAALSDLAAARLRERGVFTHADGYEDAFVAEIAAVSRQFGLPYGRSE